MRHLLLKHTKVDHLEGHYFYEISSEARNLLVTFWTHELLEILICDRDTLRDLLSRIFVAYGVA